MVDQNTLSLADAGKQINDRGISRDVIQSDERKIKGRESRATEREIEPDASEVEDSEEDDADIAEDPNPETEEPEAGADDETDADADKSEDESEEREDANPLDKEYVVKIDGETLKVPLKEIIHGYQRQADYQRKTQDLAAYRRDFTASHTKVANQYAQRVQQTAGVVQAVRNVLIGDTNSAYMQSLRQQDPQQWLVQRQAQADRIEQIDNVLSQVQQEQERHGREVEEQQQRDRAGGVAQEAAILRREIPDWDSKGAARLSSYLKSKGFTPDELNNVYDSRQLILAEKARLYDAFQADRKKGLQKQAKPIPRTVKGGGGNIKSKVSLSNGQAKQYQERKKVAKTSGNMRDAGRAIAALLGK